MPIGVLNNNSIFAFFDDFVFLLGTFLMAGDVLPLQLMLSTAVLDGAAVAAGSQDFPGLRNAFMVEIHLVAW